MVESIDGINLLGIFGSGEVAGRLSVSIMVSVSVWWWENP